MNVVQGIFLSFILHFIFFLFSVLLKLYFPKDLEIKVQKGKPRETFSFYFTSFAKKSESPTSEKKQTSEGKNQKHKKEEILGSAEEEILKIKRQISYPPEALEQGLESECEWKIKIGKNQKALEWERIKPCTHKIFEKEFEKVIRDWEFHLAEGSILNIPVSFVIEKEK